MNLTKLIAFTPAQRTAARELAELVLKGEAHSDRAKQLAAAITHPTPCKRRRKAA